MGFYDLPKSEREQIVDQMRKDFLEGLRSGDNYPIITAMGDEDTYIRKNAYMILSRLYLNYYTDLPNYYISHLKEYKSKILNLVDFALGHPNESVRQSAIHTLGEIGRIEDKHVFSGLEKGLADSHHKVKNAVVGALKRMGEKNPNSTIQFVECHLDHPDPKVRAEIIHGVELRGRTHPSEVLPLLFRAQNDPSAHVRNKIVHVLAQISYKTGCLEVVLLHLQSWENTKLVHKALQEILKVHRSYENFSHYSVPKALELMKQHFSDF